jgi:hypothetical protein
MRTTFVTDPEIIELFADEPELLAIADAITASRQFPATRQAGPGLLSRRRLVIALATIAATVAIPLVALGTTSGRWFWPGPAPVGKVVVVKSGVWDSIPWSLTADVSKNTNNDSRSVCLELTAGRRLQARSCSPIHGVPQNHVPTAAGWITYVFSSGTVGTPAFPGWIAGAAANAVANLEMVCYDGKTKEVPLLTAPSALGANVRFFVLRYPEACGETLIARDRAGKVLQRLN